MKILKGLFKDYLLKPYQKTIIFVLLYLVFLQLLIPTFINLAPIYNYRIEYDLIKNRPENIHIALQQIAKIVKDQKLQDYIVIVGDSAAYSSPGTPEQSIGYYLEKYYQEENNKTRVFNISLPSNQVGDIYTLLLMLDEYGISREHIIVNIIYTGFVVRNPYPSPVFWFYDELRKRDKVAYVDTLDMLVKNNKVKESVSYFDFETIKKDIYRHIAILNYKDVIKAFIINRFGDVKNSIIDEDGQTWHEKEFLVEMLKDPMQYRIFWDEDFDMSSDNFQVYFLNRIVELQNGKHTLFYLAPFNKELMDLVEATPNYDENIALIDDYFTSNGLQYLDLTHQIPYELYSDHIHLIPEGYQLVSKKLWHYTNIWFK
jgi:hypothetical protein